MRFFYTRLRTRARLVAAACAAAAVSAGIVLALTGTAQAYNEPWYLQPPPDIQQLAAWSGNSQGQTAAPASYASVLCVGSTVKVSFHLIRTNMPRTAFQVSYIFDQQTWTPIETLTTDRNGTGGGSFTLDDVSAGAHEVALDFNPVAGGGTYYVNLSGSGVAGMWFSCPPTP